MTTIQPYGDRAYRIRVEASGTIEFAEGLRARHLDGVTEVVGGLSSVLVCFDPDRIDPEEFANDLAIAEDAAIPHHEPRHHEIDVCFDGEDLEEAASIAEIDREDVSSIFEVTDLVVEAVGFAPGFGYLGGLPEPLRRVGRRAEPRPSVPAGSLAIAAGFAGIYPSSSPGGWHLLGRTTVALFDPQNPPYALLRPGDTVRMTPVSDLAEDPAPRRRPRTTARGRGFDVVTGGMISMLQDGGRTGFAHLGVPTAGPLDVDAALLANILVGNDATAVVLESIGAGPTLIATDDLYIAVVTNGDVTLDGRPIDPGRVSPIARGQSLRIGAPRGVPASYLAVCGGFGGREVMGSLSTDSLAWIGPGRLEKGTFLHVRRDLGLPMADHLVPGPSVDGPSTLRVVEGPHAEWFPARAIDALAGRAFSVSPTSNRVGVRLAPVDGGTVERKPGELLSEGAVPGAMQVPPSGRPILLGPDHATLGGYPVLAVVISADLGRAGQLCAGQTVTFAPVTLDQAREAHKSHLRTLKNRVAGIHPRTASG